MQRLLVLFCLMIALPCHAQPLEAHAVAETPLVGEWRIMRVIHAPWAEAATVHHAHAQWLGETVRFESATVAGPGLLRCTDASFQKTAYGSESLFEGNPSTPPTATAEKLGLTQSPVAGVRLTCTTGVFEFHFADAGTLLLGLDNHVLTLSRSAGTLAPATSAEGRVQRFLENHFDGDMAFSAEGVKTHRQWLSTRLGATLREYFARPQIEDEAPVINGDPFTDSQSYPTRFTVGKARSSSNRADVPVRFSDGYRHRTVVYALRRAGATWELDDLEFEGGETLTMLIRGPTSSD